MNRSTTNLRVVREDGVGEGVCERGWRGEGVCEGGWSGWRETSQDSTGGS